MDAASDELKQQRAIQIRSRRAADERLIAAIFGDVLFGRLPQKESACEVLAARDPAHTTSVQPVLAKSI